MKEQRVAWAITGAGHLLSESTESLLRHGNVDIFLSRAAEDLVRMYHLKDQIDNLGARVYRETLASSPLALRFAQGMYRVLIVAPATANSVAKFVHGISDSLVTNLFAQAGKSRVPILVLPVDLAPEMDSVGPHGDLVKIYPRPIDLENTEKLRKLAGVTAVSSVEEIERWLATYL